MMRFRRLLVLALLPGACERPNGQTGLTAAEVEDFVVIMRELQAADPAQRPAILAKHGSSEAELRRSITTLSADPTALSAALDSIQVAMNRDHFMAPDKFPPRSQE
jgi:hypothetical protein